MSSNEAGKWKKFKLGVAKVNNALKDNGVYNAVSKIPSAAVNLLGGINKWRAGVNRNIGKGFNWLADKLDKSVDGTELPSFIKGGANIGAGLLKTIGGIFNISASTLSWVASKCKSHQTCVICLTPDTITGALHNRKLDSTYTMCYSDNTSFLHWKVTPNIRQSDSRIDWRNDLLKEIQTNLLTWYINKRVTQFIVTAQGLNIEKVESKYEDRYGGSLVSINFYNAPQKNVQFLILKNRVKVTQEKAQVGKPDRFKIELTKLSKEERGVQKLD